MLKSNVDTARPEVISPLFSQTGQFTRAGFIKRAMDYTCRDCAFNCTAGIRRHVEHLVELKEEHGLMVFVWSEMLYRIASDSNVSASVLWLF